VIKIGQDEDDAKYFFPWLLFDANDVVGWGFIMQGECGMIVKLLNGKIILTAHGTIPFSELYPFSPLSPPRTYATFEQVCSYATFLNNTQVCNHGENGPALISLETLVGTPLQGLPCCFAGCPTLDWQLLVTVSGEASLKCTFPMQA
jgi:hypothetical protein